MNASVKEQNLFSILSSVTKLICLVLLLIAILNIDSVIGFGIFFISLFLVLFFSKAKSKKVFSTVLGLKFFIVVIFLMNLFFFSPETSIFKFWIFTPSYLGAIQGLNRRRF